MERGEGREKEWERNINVQLSLACPPWGPGLQPRHVPWQGIEPATFRFTGWHSIHWATPARAISFFLTAHIQFTLSLPYFRPPSFIGTSAMSSLSVFQFINLIGNFLCTHYTLVFIPNLCLCPHYFLHRKALLFPLIFTWFTSTCLSRSSLVKLSSRKALPNLQHGM